MLVSGCGGISIPSFGTSSPAATGEHFVYRGHDFGPSRSENYKKGVVDGCATAGGDYRKDHTLYRSDIDYKNGWEHGRLHCVKGTPAHD